jgi:alpha-galactosidase
MLTAERCTFAASEASAPQARKRRFAGSASDRFAQIVLLLLALASPLAAQDSIAVRATTAPPNAIWLEDLDISKWAQRRGTPNARTSNAGRPIALGGAVYPHGVGTRTINEFLIDLRGDAERFVAMVGPDDAAGARVSVNFELWGDDKLLASTPGMKRGDAPRLIIADLRGVRVLQIITDDGQDTSNDDDADWGGAMIVMREGVTEKPRPYSHPVEADPVIAPASSPNDGAPSINGPRVTGATPGRPFLFRIPATGAGPLTFSARNLPAGLTLDARTGIISGALKSAGRTVVDLTVKGGRGSATRALTIVGGVDALALTPPMGWNSWNAWGTSVDAEKVKAAADWMLKSGLAAHGFQYINIDDGWEGKRDSSGVLQPDPAKFPDMKSLSDYVHAQGLKIGIYSSPGPTTCGGRAGSYEHERLDAETWARWGIDYLKHDYCSYERLHPGFELSTLQAPYLVMRDALATLDRDIVYSIGNYGYGEAWKWAGSVGGHLWRTTGDLSDSWLNLESVGFRQAGRERYANPGEWNDTDMLVVGPVGWGPTLHPTNLTKNEQVLHITLWAMQAAPLLIGADLSQLDPFTLALLTNDEVLDVDLDTLGRAGSRVWKDGKLEVWSRPLADGSRAVALFNRGLKPYAVTARWSDIGVSGRQRVRDLWLKKDLGEFEGSYRVNVPRHGAVFVKVMAR